MLGYHLERVPQPPETQDWTDHLRWCVAVMDADDDDLAFMASLLSQCLTRGGLTDRQVKYAKRINDSLRRIYEAGKLKAQETALTA